MTFIFIGIWFFFFAKDFRKSLQTTTVSHSSGLQNNWNPSEGFQPLHPSTVPSLEPSQSSLKIPHASRILTLYGSIWLHAFNINQVPAESSKKSQITQLIMKTLRGWWWFKQEKNKNSGVLNPLCAPMEDQHLLLDFGVKTVNSGKSGITQISPLLFPPGNASTEPSWARTHLHTR